MKWYCPTRKKLCASTLRLPQIGPIELFEPFRFTKRTVKRSKHTHTLLVRIHTNFKVRAWFRTCEFNSSEKCKHIASIEPSTDGIRFNEFYHFSAGTVTESNFEAMTMTIILNSPHTNGPQHTAQRSTQHQWKSIWLFRQWIVIFSFPRLWHVRVVQLFQISKFGRILKIIVITIVHSLSHTRSSISFPLEEHCDTWNPRRKW